MAGLVVRNVTLNTTEKYPQTQHLHREITGIFNL